MTQAKTVNQQMAKGKNRRVTMCASGLIFSSLPFGVFLNFSSKLGKCGLESLKKTPNEDIPPIVPGPSCDNWT